MKKSNLTVPIIIVLIVGYKMFSGDEAPKNKISTNNAASLNSNAPVSSSVTTMTQTYGQRALDNSWPKMSGTDSGLATDLTVKNYYIVFDGSGSMAEKGCSGDSSKLNVAKRSLNTFVNNIPADANVGLFVFDADNRAERVPLGVNNRDRFTQAITATRAGGGTPLKTAISMAYQSLEKQAKAQLGYGEYNLVVVTDGMASSASEQPRSVVRGVLRESPIIIHTIGFCINDQHVLNQPGQTYYRQANDPASLSQGLAEVLAEAPTFDTTTFINE